MIKICIPSYKRPNDVLALKGVSEENQKKYYWLCVRNNELEEYKSNYPHCNYLDLGTDFGDRGVVETRQRINEMMSGKILVIDDDITFHETVVVPKNDFHYMRYSKDVDINESFDDMILYISELMDENPHGSIRSLLHPRDARKYMPYTTNKTCLWAVWFNLDLFDVNEVSYRTGPEFAEDIYMSCRFFELGYDLVNVCKYSIKKAKTTGSQEGGCNEHPNRGQAHNESVDFLVNMYPHLCRSKKSQVYGNENSMNMDVNAVICKLVRKLPKVSLF